MSADVPLAGLVMRAMLSLIPLEPFSSDMVTI